MVPYGMGGGGDIRLVVLAVLGLHRLRISVRDEVIEGVGTGVKGIGHGRD